MKHRIAFAGLALFALLALPRPALAAFHLMEVEQVIGGVGGDPNAQAVQLVMRTGGQNLLNGVGRLVARDAAGANPVTLINFNSNPTNAVGCSSRVLITTAAMNAKTTPAVTGAFTMTAMPASYLAAGSLTFEQTSGTIYWRVSWGGGGYTGANTLQAGTLAAGTGNDDDGNAAPPFGGVLVSAAAQALKFSPACPAPSTNNLADYANTAGAAVLVNNAGTAFTVVAPVPTPGLPGASKFLLPIALGLMVVAFALQRRRSVA